MAKDSTKGADAPAQPQPATFAAPNFSPPLAPPIVQTPPEVAPQPTTTAPGPFGSAAALLEGLPDHVRALVLQATADAQRAIVNAAEKAVARALPSVDGVQYRPPLDIPFHLLGEVVIGNFIGKGWRVADMTPVRGLPPDVLAAIRKAPGVTGPATGIVAPPAVKRAA